MKFTLKDYQEEAVKDVLVNLKKASRRWREDKDKHAFSLTATTGAGKTVMAAAVFEALCGAARGGVLVVVQESHRSVLRCAPARTPGRPLLRPA